MVQKLNAHKTTQVLVSGKHLENVSKHQLQGFSNSRLLIRINVTEYLQLMKPENFD